MLVVVCRIHIKNDVRRHMVHVEMSVHEELLGLYTFVQIIDLLITVAATIVFSPSSGLLLLFRKTYFNPFLLFPYIATLLLH